MTNFVNVVKEVNNTVPAPVGGQGA